MIDADQDGFGRDLTVTCCLGIEMIDSNNGDWEGASVRLEVGDKVEHFSLSSEDETEGSFCLSEQGRVSVYFESGEWDSEVRFVIRDPDGIEMYDSGFAPFAGLNHQQFVYHSDFATCELLANNATGSDCDDTDATLNNYDEDGDGQTSCDGDCNDLDAQLNTYDLDGDGMTPCEGDCDDFDASVYLNTDVDGDGFLGCIDDCDDKELFINPTVLKKYTMESIKTA